MGKSAKGGRGLTCDCFTQHTPIVLERVWDARDTADSGQAHFLNNFAGN